MSISGKMKGLCAALTACGLAGPVAAQGLTCVAELQCRGDAEAMCAPSTLSIEAERAGGGAHLWIDRQGPYPASVTRGADGLELAVEGFGGGHGMQVQADGAFIYRGNRGKRFSGTCEGML
ncbi:hypothetical protein [Salipiger abyssi]|nr:hypothetical protein [Salipiger abyssi]